MTFSCVSLFQEIVLKELKIKTSHQEPDFFFGHIWSTHFKKGIYEPRKFSIPQRFQVGVNYFKRLRNNTEYFQKQVFRVIVLQTIGFRIKGRKSSWQCIYVIGAPVSYYENHEAKITSLISISCLFRNSLCTLNPFFYIFFGEDNTRI